jgi:aspartyl-tRNA(Asn)/glutamyl-tRNA(Gln) amidotransferase subunit A
MDLKKLTIKEARNLLDNKQITATELALAYYEIIEKHNPDLNACVIPKDFKVYKQYGLDKAKEADAKLQAGQRGGLLGIPYLVKDNILVKGLPATAASNALLNYTASYDATIISKLNNAGAVMLAKTNLDEFAHGSSTEYSIFGPTRNPWDLSRVPGGSSGGSAAAIAADMALFALGTDTGGSVRCPAAFCGVYGLKPSYGRVSRNGLISMTSSTDVAGIFANSIEDIASVLEVIAGFDKNDLTTQKKEVDKYLDKSEDGNLKVGIIKNNFLQLSSDYKKHYELVIKELESLFEMNDMELKYDKYSVPVYYILTPAELSANLARYDGIRYGLNKDSDSLFDLYSGNRASGFGPEVKRRVILGTYVLSAGYYDAYYNQAKNVQSLIKQEYERVLKDFDVLISPTSPHTAFKLGEQSQDPWQMYLEDQFLAGPSLAGLAAISVPVAQFKNMPMGLQIIAAKGNEDKVLQMAKKIEDNKQWLIKPSLT